MRTVLNLLFSLVFLIISLNCHSNAIKRYGSSFYTQSVLSSKSKDSILEKKLSNVSVLFKQKKFDKALNKAFEILEALDKNQIDIQIRTNFLIGNIFYETSSYKNGIKYFRKNIELISNESILLENKNNVGLKANIYSVNNFHKLGSSYHKLKEIDSRPSYKDSTIYYYNKVVSLESLESEILDIKAIVYNNLSALYINDTLYDKARIYANKSIDIHKSREDKINQAAATGNLGSIYLLQNNYKLAKKTYLKGLELIKNDTSSKAVRFRSSLYFNLAWALRNLEDYKAYDYQESAYEIKDELRDSEFRSSIKKINAEYDFEVKKELLLKQEENKRLKDQQTFWFIGIIALIIILSLTYVLNLYKLKQKNLALNFAQKELLKNQEIERVKSEAQVRILNATIDGKESERKQIAETLHDSVSALLSSANMHLQATRKQFNGSTPVEIDKSQKIIEEASLKVRDLSHNLVSSVLLKFGLNFAVSDIAEKYSNSQLSIETEIGTINRYQQNFEIKVYNIIQEFINNVLKHSQADNALIELKEENNNLILIISDDGIGFDKTKINLKSGLGLNQIEARIQMMKGKFNIVSSKNNGTKINIKIPVIEKEAPTHV